MTDRWIAFVVALAVALLVAGLVALAVTVAVGTVARRWSPARRLVVTARRPLRVLLAMIAMWSAVAASLPVQPAAGGVPEGARDAIVLLCRVVTIAAVAWLLSSVLLFLEDRGLARHRVDVADNRQARRLRTQMLIVRRLTVCVVVVLALGAMLLSLPGARAVGASVLASAGIVSIVAALAAQSTLGNVIAGIQIAFSDAIRYDDAIIVEGEWGWVEEITLSYVVVRLWDDRRMVLPSTWFTTNPFQNWTRNHSELLGTVDLDLDWRADTDGLRAAATRALHGSDLWDGRVDHLQVTDAVNGLVHVRVLVTARDAPTLFDLRCHVREELVRWLRTENPEGLPHVRVEGARVDA